MKIRLYYRFMKSRVIHILKRSAVFIAVATLLGFPACKSKKRSQRPVSMAPVATASAPAFSGDSAYRFVADQLAFGPRVPNTPAHKACGDWFVSKLKDYGAEVTEQTASIKACDGKLLEMRNIIASYNPQAMRRILIAAHWDCRPWCDQDSWSNRNQPVQGANDGASGAAVLLEIARQWQDKETGNLGIDLIFFDTEDYGNPSWEHNDNEDTWCLGSQYWAKHPHKAGYRAEYGILLDMVGGKSAGFLYEYFSWHYASAIVQKVWSKAAELGFGGTFIQRQGGAVTDDHLYVNRLAGIPCIDIIDFDPDYGGFPETWHTVNDDLSHIDAQTLQTVGQTLMAVLEDEI